MTIIEAFGKREERIEKFKDILNTRIVDPPIHQRGTKGFVRWLTDNGYFDAPASARHHGTNSGDLFRHSLAVASVLDDYTGNLGLEWQRPSSPWIVGMFHDLCKMDQYIADTGTGIFADGEEIHNSSTAAVKWIWNDKQLISGHGDKSVMLLSQFIELTEEELLCIRYHMGAYNQEDWGRFDLAIRKYPNVLYTHTADMYASKVMSI